MYEQLCIFFTAVMFFTRIPYPKWMDYSEVRLNKSAMYFPLVGCLVGATAAFIFVLGLFIFPKSVALLLSMIASVIFTGAFHEDGWADVCDGFGGGWNKQDILRIMKDSRIGVYGTIGLIVILALKFVALYEMEMELVPWALIAGHSMSRFVSTSFLYTHSYVRENEDSRAKPLATRISWQGLAVAAFFGITPVLLLGNAVYFFVIVPLVICKWCMGKYFVKWIGGYTGDCLGAAQQVPEVLFYLFIILISW
ncbi:MAG: adenosylcobinamide-GDP ribazoletransferase [Deltaproteobacteria bacterium]|nr:adenosylcobinamide-GDP ribazoletransferase [Deltaproteobacteria bacterium]